MDLGFSEKELRIRKWWLRLFLCTCLYSSFMFFKNPANHVPEGYIGFSIGLLSNLATYYFGYRKMGTRWLTTLLFISGLSLVFLAILLVGSVMSHNIFLQTAAEHYFIATQKIGIIPTVISNVFSLSFLYLTFRLRKINKSRKSQNIIIV